MRPILYMTPGLGDTRLGVAGKRALHGQYFLDARESSAPEATASKPDVAAMTPWGSGRDAAPNRREAQASRVGNHLAIAFPEPA